MLGASYPVIDMKLWEEYHGWCDSNGIRSLSLRHEASWSIWSSGRELAGEYGMSRANIQRLRWRNK